MKSCLMIVLQDCPCFSEDIFCPVSCYFQMKSCLNIACKIVPVFVRSCSSCILFFQMKSCLNIIARLSLFLQDLVCPVSCYFQMKFCLNIIARLSLFFARSCLSCIMLLPKEILPKYNMQDFPCFCKILFVLILLLPSCLNTNARLSLFCKILFVLYLVTSK